MKGKHSAAAAEVAANQPQSAAVDVSSDTDNFQSGISLVVTPFTTDEWHKADAYTLAERPAVVADAKAYIRAHVGMTPCRIPMQRASLLHAAQWQPDDRELRLVSHNGVRPRITSCRKWAGSKQTR
jgi:hypothetical protein